MGKQEHAFMHQGLGDQSTHYHLCKKLWQSKLMSKLEAAFEKFDKAKIKFAHQAADYGSEAQKIDICIVWYSLSLFWSPLQQQKTLRNLLWEEQRTTFKHWPRQYYIQSHVLPQFDQLISPAKYILQQNRMFCIKISRQTFECFNQCGYKQWSFGTFECFNQCGYKQWSFRTFDCFCRGVQSLNKEKWSLDTRFVAKHNQILAISVAQTECIRQVVLQLLLIFQLKQKCSEATRNASLWVMLDHQLKIIFIDHLSQRIFTLNQLTGMNSQ